MKTPDEIPDDAVLVEKANELAREFYASFGYTTPKGYRFDRATHPQEMSMWNLAVIAYEFLTATDLNDALSNLEETNDG